MDAFSRMINASISKGLISGFSVGARELDQVNVSHLLFGDDTLVFYGADPNQIRYIRALLICFETISRLKVNLAKSTFVLIGTLDNVGDLAGILGCGVASLPLKYFYLWGLHLRSRLFGMTCCRSMLVGLPLGNTCIFL
jgi:hypothetical protein